MKYFLLALFLFSFSTYGKANLCSKEKSAQKQAYTKLVQAEAKWDQAYTNDSQAIAKMRQADANQKQATDKLKQGKPVTNGIKPLTFI